MRRVLFVTLLLGAGACREPGLDPVVLSETRGLERPPAAHVEHAAAATTVSLERSHLRAPPILMLMR
jgi:hypothetical protein